MIKRIQLTTPVAIIIAAGIISLGIICYGFITSSTSTPKLLKNPIPSFLKEFDIDKDAFATCMNNDATKNAIDVSIEDGIKAGVTGTPTSFVVKKEGNVLYTVAVVEGAQTYDFLKQAVEEALSLKDVKGKEVFKGKSIGTEEPVQGSTTGNVYIIEYSDTECPFCIRFHPTITQVREEYKDKVAFIYRHFPLTQIHSQAAYEAGLIDCSYAVTKNKETYFNFMDAIFNFKTKNEVGVLPLGK